MDSKFNWSISTQKYEEQNIRLHFVFCEICKMFKNTFFYRTPASEHHGIEHADSVNKSLDPLAC